MTEEKYREYYMLLLCNQILLKSGKLTVEEYEKIKADLKKQYEK